MNEIEELSERLVVVYTTNLKTRAFREAFFDIPDTIAELEAQRLSAVNSNFHD